MTSILKVDTIQDTAGNNIINESSDTITIGASGDTVTIPSGATLDASGATLTLPTTIEVDTIEPQSGTSLTLGASGDTITIPSGATITNSGTATGFGGGKVLQVVSDTSTTAVATTSTSFIDIGLELSITPSSASNKIFLLYTGINETNGASKYCELQMLRDATQLAIRRALSVANGYYALNSISKLDSPNTTSAITYKMQGNAGDGTVCVFNILGYLGTLTAFEIEG